MSTPTAPIERLRTIVAALRHPETGCPWDLKQDHQTLKRYLIEEAYELLEAIDEGEDKEIMEECGDVLLQVVFHAQLAKERGAFDLDDVVTTIADKMVERHPHVFAGATAEEGLAAWEARKQDAGKRVLDGVPRALPALHRAQRISAKAATVGFDWPSFEPVIGKVDEELDELKAAIATGDQAAILDELGDTLFSLTNLARTLGLDAEDALASTLNKFERRFHHIEDRLAEQGRHPRDASLEEMDALWEEAKARNRSEP